MSGTKIALLWVILVVGIAISISAAVYSVTGMMTVFSGSAMAIAILIGSVEIAKLAVASALKVFWDDLSRTYFLKFLRVYLVAAVAVIMILTSGGIYGYLSSAFQQTKDQLIRSEKMITLIGTKKASYDTRINAATAERDTIASGINNLRNALSNNQINWKDRATGQILTSNDPRQRRALEIQLNDAINRRNTLDSLIPIYRDTVLAYELNILDLESNNEASTELGPVRFISETFDWSLNQTVNVYLIMIMFVFDPLALGCVLFFTTLMFAPVHNTVVETTVVEVDDNDVEEEIDPEPNAFEMPIMAAEEPEAYFTMESRSFTDTPLEPAPAVADDEVQPELAAAAYNTDNGTDNDSMIDIFAGLGEIVSESLSRK